jgi:transcriptional regulator with XRE-family HTH domain
MRKFKVIVEKTSTGYSAYADKYPVYTTGRDVKELESNIIEAMNFSLRELGEDISVARKNLEFSFSIPSLFQLYPINLKHFAQRIGMNYTLLAQYVQGRKKPSEKQTEKIVEGLQEVGRELSDVDLI